MEDRKGKEIDPACRSLCSKREVPDEKELEALKAMRTIKDRVRSMRKRIAEVSASNEEGHIEEIQRLEGEIARLKDDWKLWDKKRERAARERMIALGHESRVKAE